MEILELHCTNIRLEEGDLIAIDEKNRLYISMGNRIYVSCNPIDLSHLEREICVNSAGLISKRQNHFSKLDWKEYHPRPAF
jgi:hypothetical protein